MAGSSTSRMRELGCRRSVTTGGPRCTVSRLAAMKRQCLSATGPGSPGGIDVLFVPGTCRARDTTGRREPAARAPGPHAETRRYRCAGRATCPGLVVAGTEFVGPLVRWMRETRTGRERPRGGALERLRDRSLATWRSTWRDDPFSPGRLDYLLYRGEVIEVERAFVFDAADMSPVARDVLGIMESDTGKSDHLPLVVDFLVR